MGRAPRADACRNRDRLLEAASEAFARDGVDASLEKIAKAAGVGIGTLYRHFPNKDVLMEAVYRHNLDQMLADADELLATKPAAEALAEWMQRFVAYVATKKGLAMHLKTVVSADSDLFTSSQERMGDTMRRMVEAGVAEGEIRPDVDPTDVLRALAGVCMTSDMTQSQEQPCRIAQLLMDGLRYGAASASR
ncbi:MAG TPA: TetR family transcriptional regulator [Mycobacteriales bacterium]|jgi:AcrR family transcriptional regulator|nr:TetR family transcriptional regulator [Mycobacteriales bacterium]